ncbi:MAG: acyl carrier protein [Bacteroidales bacterium]|nr:acyl carrier protein [Bacteroidales bacterium]
MEQLIQKLKEEIIEALNLSEMKPADIDEKAPLFVDGLGLDSIDALELTVLLEKKYGLKINTAEEGKKILHSVNSMAEFITANKKS